ncbi:MAG: hypothetical protein HRU15_02360 [Planctomycetes bacterium]|nr:hypothetical protein [Planctomycetota bacterium]
MDLTDYLSESVQLLLCAKVVPLHADTRGIMDVISNNLHIVREPHGVQRLEEGAEVSSDSEDSGLAGGGYSFEQEQREQALIQDKIDKESKDKDLRPDNREEEYELSQIERIRVLKNSVLDDRARKMLRALKHYQQPSGEYQDYGPQDKDREAGADYHI